jgi:hypothetical protein
MRSEKLHKNSNIENYRRWIAFSLWPLFFYILAVYIGVFENHARAYWINEILGYFTDFVPHLKKLKNYAFSEIAFNLIMSLSSITGIGFGVHMAYIIAPLILKRKSEEKIEFIKKHIWFYPGLVLFMILGLWVLWIDGPASVNELTRFTRSVTKSNLGIATYGVIYYLASLAVPMGVLSILLMMPMHIRYYLKRSK